jgi:hypothetical protein
MINTEASTADEILVAMVARSIKNKDRSEFLRKCSGSSKGFVVARFAGALAKRFHRLVRDTRGIVAGISGAVSSQISWIMSIPFRIITVLSNGMEFCEAFNTANRNLDDYRDRDG